MPKETSSPTPAAGAAVAPAAPKSPPAPTTAAPATPGPVQRVVVSMSVNFVLNTTDGLRQVTFGLEKDTKGTDIEWQIHFKLLERAMKTDAFDTIVTLDVDVKTSLIPQAEAMAHNKPTADQAAHIVGPLADDAKLVDSGDLPKSVFDDEAQQAMG